MGVSRTCELGEEVIFDSMVREALLTRCGPKAGQELGWGYLGEEHSRQGEPQKS